VTYLQFHLVFIMPPLLVAAWLARGSVARLGPRARWALPAVLAIAFVYTTPWDNYLVARGVWGYGEDRVIGTIGWVPVEEYLFFLLQPLVTGFWLYYLLAGRGRGEGEGEGRDGAVRAVGALVYLAVAVAGAMLLRTEAGTYMGLILAWSCPVLAGQWAFAGDIMARRLRTVVVAIAVPTLWLWFADAYAIRAGIWYISETFTLGYRPFGLPIEEATFFLVTNILVVQGLLLFLVPRAEDSGGGLRTWSRISHLAHPSIEPATGGPPSGAGSGADRAP
jgi:lycopene beta-cyclase